MIRRRRAQLLVLLLAGAWAALGAVAGPALGQDDADDTTCPGTFQVLHEVHVDGLRVPPGAYTIATGGTLVCREAARLLGEELLPVWNGTLPNRWHVDADARRFLQGPSDEQSFTLTRASVPKGSGTVPPGGSCPYLTLTANMHLGDAVLHTGRYRVALLTPRGLTCTAALRTFFGFQDGQVDDPWRMHEDGTDDVTLRDTDAGTGFALRRAYSAVDGGGTYPTADEDACSGPFSVRNDDPIGPKLTLHKGAYGITVFGGLDCADAVKALRVFLGLPKGDLPAPWRLRPDSASFVRSAAGTKGLRVEPWYG